MHSKTIASLKVSVEWGVIILQCCSHFFFQRELPLIYLWLYIHLTIITELYYIDHAINFFFNWQVTFLPSWRFGFSWRDFQYFLFSSLPVEDVFGRWWMIQFLYKYYKEFTVVCYNCHTYICVCLSIDDLNVYYISYITHYLNVPLCIHATI